MAAGDWQITTRDLLVSTLWLGVGFGSCSGVIRHVDVLGTLAVPLAALALVSPFMAVGALLGRQLQGLFAALLFLTVAQSAIIAFALR